MATANNATTRQVTTRDLTSVQSITYIRPIAITITVKDARPTTVMNVFFDGINVNQYCRQVNATKFYDTTGTLVDADLLTAGTITTDSAGYTKFIFTVPARTFTTGNKEMLVTDAVNYSDLAITGNVYGSASANFNSKGIKEIWQQTKTTTITTVNYVNVFRSDPLAQSFFTYGQAGGVFITSIELYFQSKDTTIPVRVELRRMENGFPTELDRTNPDLVASVAAADVAISSTALTPTKFTFPVPVYLPEDGDYCFVVFSNSKKYNIWTSKMGEKSIETGRYIYEQPFVGSMFKSENNYTWTPEQTEDIKFKINKAVFPTNVVSDITLSGTAPTYAVLGENMTTINGSPNVAMRFSTQHGLTASSKIGVSASSATNALFNGISGANLSGNFTINKIIDEYTVEFIASANATSTGPITSSNVVTGVTIVNGGTGYTSAPTVTIGAPPSGTTATATATVLDGKIVAITMTNNGSGYTSNPQVTIGGPGSGSEVYATVDPVFAVSTNKTIHTISPQLQHSILAGTSLVSTLKPTTSTYGNADDVSLPLDRVKRLANEAMIASRINEFTLMSNANSLELLLEMSTSNPNVSPVIDTRKYSALMAYTNALNNQTEFEDVTSTNKTSTVGSITITNGGSGYTTDPTVVFTPAENETSDTIVAPTVSSVTRSGNVVTAVNLATNGSGYTRAPIISFTGGSGSGATATANMTLFNSELNTVGTAYSRYITKRVRLATISTDVKLLSYIYSTPETSVDWYIRTSLSSDSTLHESRSWTLLTCDVARNKSSIADELFEYEFYSSNLGDFDTYDLKCVFRSTNPVKSPSVRQYRVVVVA